MELLCVQVCAFFDDATLANSLPNGKRKRGLNDNRKGLDQNIVGAIKGEWEKDTFIIVFVAGQSNHDAVFWGMSDIVVSTVSSVYREILHWAQNREVAWAAGLGTDSSRSDQTCEEEAEKRYCVLL